MVGFDCPTTELVESDVLVIGRVEEEIVGEEFGFVLDVDVNDWLPSLLPVGQVSPRSLDNRRCLAEYNHQSIEVTAMNPRIIVCHEIDR